MTSQEQLDLRAQADAKPPVLVTTKDAGRMLAVSRSTVYELIAVGDLEVVHIGRSVRVPLDAIASYIAHLRKTPTR